MGIEWFEEGGLFAHANEFDWFARYSADGDGGFSLADAIELCQDGSQDAHSGIKGGGEECSFCRVGLFVVFVSDSHPWYVELMA
jgi:hypothetical protein